MTGKKKPAKRVDWETIEKDWRAGLKTKLQMSEEYGVSRAAMDKHFAKLGIDRDLSEKIRQRAEALVTQQAVTQEVTKTRLVTTEREIVETNAQVAADALLGQRKDIARFRALVQTMLAQLEAESGSPEVFAEIGEILARPDDRGQDKLNDAYHKAISLPQRIDGVKKLAETLKTLIGLERQALGMSDNAEGDKPPQAEEITAAITAAEREALRAIVRAAA